MRYTECGSGYGGGCLVDGMEWSGKFVEVGLC